MKPEQIQPGDWPMSDTFAHGWKVPAGNRLYFFVNALSNPFHLVEVDVIAADGARSGVR